MIDSEEESFKRNVYGFSIDYDAIDKSDIQNKMENNKFKRFRIKNRTCYYFDNIIKLEDFDIDNILIDEKPHKNILICGIP